MKVPKIVLLIFVSGKVVLTGAKQRDEIYQAFENIYPVLNEFKKQLGPAPPGAISPGDGQVRTASTSKSSPSDKPPGSLRIQ